MQDHTETLTIGSRAPEFTLPAANRSGTSSLAELLRQGALVVEFLRGTW
jgi:peroxiredoxin